MSIVLRTEGEVDGRPHALGGCGGAGEEPLERRCPLLHQHLPAVGGLDATFAKGAHPPRLAGSVDQVERALHARNVVQIDWQWIVTGEPERRGADRYVDFDQSRGDSGPDADL